MEEEIYGIDKDYAHERAIELISEDFFWSSTNELAPFGSDDGDMALSEFRDWKKENPQLPIYECLKWTIESVGEMEVSDYNEKILDRNLIKSQSENEMFGELPFRVDISVIATGFGQLVDEGKIDELNKPLIQLAIDRQKMWTELIEDWEHKNEYMSNLKILERALKDA